MQICSVCAFISVIELPRIPAYYPKIWDRSAYGFFTPETTGSYAILSGEDHPAFLFDESGKNVSEQNGVFDLQAGHKYTILNTEFFSETEAHISAELAYNIASIEPVGDFSQKTTYYFFMGRVGAPLTVVHPSQNSGRAVFPHPALCETNRSHYHSYILTYIRGLTSG